MQGSIEQSIALTVAGNAFLQGRDIGGFWPNSPVFAYCSLVRFVRAASEERSSEETPVAPDPLAWFESLAGEAIGLRLHAVRRDRPEMPDWMNVGFAGGGSRWLIETSGSGPTLLWSDEWTVADRREAGDRPWSVTYRGSPGLAPVRPMDLDGAEQGLRRALEAILAFAREIESHFAEFFERALDILDQRAESDRSAVRGFAPPGFATPQAERLLAACRTAWVFGGMGAWNDGAYGGAEMATGDELTTDLHDRLQLALGAAASSTCAP